jgi:hypothetical protein
MSWGGRRRLAVANARRISIVLATGLSGILAGCSGGTTFNVQNPTLPIVPTVAITFQSSPPTSIPVGNTISLSAVVSNDSSNSGVDWTVTCASAGNCGSLSAPHTASGTATVYTPPPSISGNSQPITIAAFATADHTQNVVASIAITGFAGNLKGTYILQAQGIDSNFNPYQYAGAVVFDGNGGVTSGEQTVNFFDFNIGEFLSKPDAITGGSYSLGSDGRGTININTGDEDLGTGGVELFSFVFLSNSQALITALPTSSLLLSATGTMDLQTAVAAPAAGYAFVVSGTDFATGLPVATGGIFNIDSPKKISGTGSVTDQNLAGTLTAAAPLSGTLSNPDALGAFTLNLTTPTFPTTGSSQFTGYIVDATHIKLIESDNAQADGIGSTVGQAIGQGSATGSFGSSAAFSGTYVFGALGQDLSAYSPFTMTSAGVFTADGAGNVTNGAADVLLQSNSVAGTVGVSLGGTFDGKYVVQTAGGTGRVRATFNHFSSHPLYGFSPVYMFYLTGNGNPPLVLASGDINYTFLGAGIAYPQTAPLTFAGPYGFSISQQNGSENDGTGQMTAGATPGTLAGVVDINLASSSALLGNPFTGAFTMPGANGQFSGSITGQVFEFSPFAVNYYAVDAGHGFFVETDLADPNLPTGVVSFGYYAPRTPVCSTCQ